MGLAILGNLLTAGATLGATAMTNEANAKAVEASNAANAANVKETNEANLEQVRLTNAANAEQANLAYQRSLPVNQVRDLMDAGMSKAGALNKLAGGGVYTPPALQAGTSQPATAQTPHFDYSGIAQAAERIANIPANAVQLEYNKEQINALREDLRIKREQEKRAVQLHQYNLWKEQYGKDTATILDAVSSRVSDALLQSGKEISDFKTFESLIRGLNLQDDKDIKRLPHIARTQLYDSVSQKFADVRARQQQEDTHDLALLEKQLKKINISEEQQSLIYKLGILANNLELSKLNVDASNYEKILRDAGFENKKEAAAAIAAAENLEAKIRKDHARFSSDRSNSTPAKVGYSLQWLVDIVNPFKGLIGK